MAPWRVELVLPPQRDPPLRQECDKWLKTIEIEYNEPKDVVDSIKSKCLTSSQGKGVG